MKRTYKITGILPTRIKKAREMRDLDQTELGKIAGIPSTSISHFEIGTRMPSAENLYKLATALRVSSDYLLGIPEGLAYSEGLINGQLDVLKCLHDFFRSKNER